jgi:hypothetical protein
MKSRPTSESAPQYLTVFECWKATLPLGMIEECATVKPLSSSTMDEALNDSVFLAICSRLEDRIAARADVFGVLVRASCAIRIVDSSNARVQVHHISRTMFIK